MYGEIYVYYCKLMIFLWYRRVFIRDVKPSAKNQENNEMKNYVKNTRFNKM